MTLSKCTICNSKKSKFINQQEVKGLLSKLGIKTSLSKIPILGNILFWMHTCFSNNSRKATYKNEWSS